MVTAAVLGATGLVGSALVDALVADPEYRHVRLIVRRASGREHDKLDERVVDFEQLDRADFEVDRVFCCLGTTIKKAGSRDAFRRVDRDYPLQAARLAAAAGAKQYLIVTAVGADADSAFFYNRVKGELEQELSDLVFPEGLTIVRPSLLLGERQESRRGEAAAAVVMRAAAPLLTGFLARYRAIDASAVARALQNAAASPTGGVRVLEGELLFEMAQRR